ncbi:hypothetical protein [Butyrivibrio sp. AE2032]|uniref:hypothetical protein n=1 Tax=Butyrivibrio sp. AE2032 TaxID=1458463 RepID=UPI0005500539|nr:hypothetical protein [Butyrivibrio sp. AE2032]
MICDSCGREWNMPERVARIMKKCPFCQADLKMDDDDLVEEIILPPEMPKTAKVESLADLSAYKDFIARFFMNVKDIFPYSDRGTIVYGTLISGDINVGDTVYVVFADGRILSSSVSGIEIDGEKAVYAWEGIEAGLILSDLNRDDLRHAIGITNSETGLMNNKFVGYVTLKYENERELIDQSYTTIKIFHNEKRGYLMEGCGYFTFIDNDNRHPGMEKAVIELVEQPLFMIPQIDFAVFKGDEEITKGFIDSIIE